MRDGLGISFIDGTECSNSLANKRAMKIEVCHARSKVGGNGAIGRDEREGSALLVRSLNIGDT